MGRSGEFKEASGGPRVGDRVDLGGGNYGQLWSQAAGPNQWHAVDENGKAHFWNAKTQSARPASEVHDMNLADYRGLVDRRYGAGGPRQSPVHAFGKIGTTGRNWNVGQQDIADLKRAAGVKRAPRRKAS